jgi:predicted DNA-binding transcriptional regulator AlpA
VSNHINPARLAVLERRGRALRPKTAAAVIDVSISTFWSYAAKDPTFPKVFKLGPGSSGASAVWEHELLEWVRKRSEAPIQLPRLLKPGPGRGHKKSVGMDQQGAATAARVVPKADV